MLPAHAPFGAVEIDTPGCTLCLSCVAACPTGALSDDPNRPMLRFSEEACVQSGLSSASASITSLYFLSLMAVLTLSTSRPRSLARLLEVGVFELGLDLEQLVVRVPEALVALLLERGLERELARRARRAGGTEAARASRRGEPCRRRSPGSSSAWSSTRLQNGHWKSENSTIVTSALSGPLIGESPTGTFQTVLSSSSSGFFFLASWAAGRGGGLVLLRHLDVDLVGLRAAGDRRLRPWRAARR